MPLNGLSKSSKKVSTFNVRFDYFLVDRTVEYLVLLVCMYKNTDMFIIINTNIDQSIYLLQSHFLWHLSKLVIVVRSQLQTGRCTVLPGMCAVQGTPAVHVCRFHGKLAHPLLCHCHSLGSHPDLTSSLPDGILTPQCSWGCRKPQQTQ